MKSALNLKISWGVSMHVPSLFLQAYVMKHIPLNFWMIDNLITAYKGKKDNGNIIVWYQQAMLLAKKAGDATKFMDYQSKVIPYLNNKQRKETDDK